MAASPAHSLEAIQRLVREGRHVITVRAMDDAMALGFDDVDIAECVACLDETDFYKSMPSAKKAGHYQDVYKTTYSSLHLYLKFDLTDTAVVISFKEDESA